MKILYITTIGMTMGFFKSFVRELIDKGHTVDITTNESDSKVPDCYREWGCAVYPISCSRSPFKMGNLQAIKQIKKLVELGKYDIVHCHTPIAAMCTRLACKKLRKKGEVKVFYTAHGFHFYKGAPLKNWMIYYPIEKLCSQWTDVLITINQEDYVLAQNKMKAKRVEYVPGVGVDLEKFRNVTVDRAAKRKEVGIPEDAILLLSVGELNENKNHEVIVRALSKISNAKMHYAIAGIGERKDYLTNLANKLNVGSQIHLLGFRKDVAELYHCADICCFTSIREGLGLAAIEGMACGLPLIAADNRGTRDYAVDGITGYSCQPFDVDGFAKKIHLCVSNLEWSQKVGQGNITRVQKYDIFNVQKIMFNIYESIYKHF